MFVHEQWVGRSSRRKATEQEITREDNGQGNQKHHDNDKTVAADCWVRDPVSYQLWAEEGTRNRYQDVDAIGGAAARMPLGEGRWEILFVHVRLYWKKRAPAQYEISGSIW